MKCPSNVDDNDADADADADDDDSATQIKLRLSSCSYLITKARFQRVLVLFIYLFLSFSKMFFISKTSCKCMRWLALTALAHELKAGILALQTVQIGYRYILNRLN